MLGLLENGLFALGQIMRLPVICMLWVCVFAVLFMVGRCIMDMLARRRERNQFDLESWLKRGSVLAAEPPRLAELPHDLWELLTAVSTAHKEHRLDEGGLENILLMHEGRLRKTLSGSHMLIKVGPSLGLLGTLIPMGASLAAMASGNLEAMAGQMVVAFTTTIVGIACGTTAFVINNTRQAWVRETIREQRYLAEKMLRDISEPS